MLRIAFQIDPPETLNPTTDGSMLLMQEAIKRGFKVFAYCPSNLHWNKSHLTTPLFHVTQKGQDIIFHPGDVDSLESFDYVWIRQNPPFDQNYLTNTYLLSLIEEKTLFLNKPSHIRNFSEKLLFLEAPDISLPSLITSTFQEALHFLETEKDIILKPLFDFGGRGVFRIQKASDLSDHWHTGNSYILQKFLPNITKGEKRLFFVEGEYLGGFTKVPQKNNYLANLAQGGSIMPLEEVPCSLIEKISTFLKKKGIFLAGIDAIDTYVIECNITSPTGFHAFNTFHDHQPIQGKIWDAALKQKGAAS